MLLALWVVFAEVVEIVEVAEVVEAKPIKGLWIVGSTPTSKNND